MTDAGDLAERLAGTLQQRATNDRMPSVGLSAGLVSRAGSSTAFREETGCSTAYSGA
jgi:hypothetical protein